MKSVALLSANAPDAVPWLLEHAGRWGRDDAFLRPLTVQVGVPDLSGQPPRYEAVLEIWGADVASADSLIIEPLTDRFAVDLYFAEELVAKPAASPPAVGITPGISSLSFIKAKPALSRAEALRHWSEHAPLACAIHWGMTRYVQNRFQRRDGATSGWFGMAHLHFPDAAASREGLFRTAEDRAAITADVAEFVDEYATMLAVEHVIRD